MTIGPRGEPLPPFHERAKSAVLSLVPGVNVDIHEQHVRIDFVPLYGFALVSATGIVIATSEHPLPLCRYAWANGAMAIHHDYDLRRAE